MKFKKLMLIFLVLTLTFSFSIPSLAAQKWFQARSSQTIASVTCHYDWKKDNKVTVVNNTNVDLAVSFGNYSCLVKAGSEKTVRYNFAWYTKDSNRKSTVKVKYNGSKCYGKQYVIIKTNNGSIYNN